jgi:CRP-like cAMP-binding protein
MSYKIYPEHPMTYKYHDLWKKSIKKIILASRAIKLMRVATLEAEKNFSESIMSKSAKLLKSKTVIKLPFMIMDPGSQIKELWNLFIGLLIIYTCIVTPFTLSFYDISSASPLYKIDIFIDVCFILDLISNLNLAYYDHANCLISTRYMIFKHYLKRGMLIDLVASFPFTLIDSLTSGSYSNILKVLRLRALSKLLKLSRIVKVMGKTEYSLLKDIQGFLSISHSFARLLKFLSMTIITLHICACMWHWAAKNEDFGPSSWVYQYGCVDDPVYRKYLISLYWAMTTLSTIGYGDVHAYSNIEKLISIFWMGFAVYFLSYSISNLSSMLSEIDYKKTLMRKKMNFIDEFSKEIKLSKRLKKEIQKKLLESIERFNYSYSDRTSLLNDFPKDLKLEIAYDMHNGIATKFPLFSQESDSFLLEILPLMENMSVQGLRTIYSYGEHANKIYFLVKGKVHYVIPNEKTVFQVFNNEEYFGDIEVLLNTPRLNCSVAVSECTFIIMGVDILKKIHSFFPNFYSKIKDAAKKRYKILTRNIIEMKMLLELNKRKTLNIDSINSVRNQLKEEYKNIDWKQSTFSKKFKKYVAVSDNLEMTSKTIEDCKHTLDCLNQFLDKFCTNEIK